MKGLGIIAVVIGHMNAPEVLRKFIFSFHMPLFFLIAGFFHHQKSNIILAKNSFRRLVIPYLFTALVVLVFSFFESFCGKEKDPQWFFYVLSSVLYGSGAAHTSFLLGGMPAIGAIWFLLALFWCKIVYNFIGERLKNRKGFIVAVLSTAMLATYVDKYFINMPLSFLPGLSAMTFYMIGDLYKECVSNRIVIFLCIVCWLISWNYSYIVMVNCNYGFYPLDVLGGVGGTLLIGYAATFLEKFPRFQFFDFLGYNSLIILCFHLIEMNCKMCSRLHIPQVWYYELPVKIGFCVIMTYFCYKFPVTRYVFSINNNKKIS